MSEYTRKAFYGFMWVALGAFIANVAAYGLRLVLARNLTIDEYGLVYAILAFFGLLSVFQHMGMGEALTKFTSAARVNRDADRISAVVSWALVVLYASTFLIGIGVFLGSEWLAAVYFKSALAAPMLRTYSIAFFLGSIGIVAMAVFQGYQRMDLHAFYAMLQSILLLIITFLLIMNGYGAYGAMLAYVILLAILYPVVALLFWRLRLRISWSAPARTTVAELFSYGLPVMLTGVAGMLLTFTDTALLTLLSDLEEVGIYQAALPTANILLFLVSIIAAVLFPLIAEMWERKHKELIVLAVDDLYKYSLILILPLVIGFMIFPQFILTLLFGGEYARGAPVLMTLAGAALFLVMNAIHTAALSGIGVPMKNMKAIATGALINVIGNILLVPLLGGLGAATATLIAATVIFGMSGHFLRQQIAVRFPLKKWLLTLLAGAGFVTTIIFMRSLPLQNQYVKVALALAAATCVYGALIFLFRVTTVPELATLRKRILFRRA